MVARLTATWLLKKSLTASSLGDVPGGVVANANWAKDLTLMLMMASISSVLSPALAARYFKASVEYTRDAASLGAAAM